MCIFYPVIYHTVEITCHYLVFIGIREITPWNDHCMRQFGPTDHTDIIVIEEATPPNAICVWCRLHAYCSASGRGESLLVSGHSHPRHHGVGHFV